MFLTVLAIVLSISIFPIYIVASAYEDERKRLDGEADEHQDGHQGTHPDTHSRMAETYEVRDGESFGERSGESSTVRVGESGESFGESGESIPVVDMDLGNPFPLPDTLKGMTLKEFKQFHCPNPGGLNADYLGDSDVRDIAKLRVFEDLKKYGNVPIEFLVWSVFGITKQGGTSPSARRYQSAAEFVTQTLKQVNRR